MALKYLVSFLVIISSVALAAAQTPEPPKAPQSQIFSWSYDSNGGYLGVQTEEVSKENFAKFGLKDVKGVAVAKVVEGSPAQAGGIQDGDVILRVNGEDITSSKKLTRLITEIAPDHIARVRVSRGGSERDLDVTIGKRPMPKFENGNFSFSFPEMDTAPGPGQFPGLEKLPRIQTAPGQPNAPMTFSFGSRRQIGVGVMPLTKQLADHYGVENGALVTDVRKDSPAEKAGLKAGDIIVEADGKAVKGNGDLVNAISEKKEGEVKLTVVRDRGRQTISVTPEEMKGGFEMFEFNGPASAPGAPDAPKAPGLFRMTRPAVPAMPLNQLTFPGRVI